MTLNFDYRKDYLEVKTEFKDLKEIKDTKHEQEMAVVNKIMQLLNNRNYNDIEDFYSKNNNLQDFIKKHFHTPLTHFGHNESPLNEEDYINIIENMRNISKRKQSIETKDINTTNVDRNEYNSMKIDGVNRYVDNTNSNQKIEDTMKDLQSTSNDYQTIDPTKNAENMFKEIQNRQDILNPLPLNEINRESLNDRERELFDSAINFQLNYMTPIKVDLNKAVIVDKDNNIMKITKENGEIMVITDENGVEKEEKMESENTKSYQKQLTPNLNTIYSN